MSPVNLLGRMVVHHLKPTQKLIPANTPAKNGWSCKFEISMDRRADQSTNRTMDVLHISRCELEQLNRDPLQGVGHKSRYRDRRVDDRMAKDHHSTPHDEEWPEEVELAQDAPASDGACADMGTRRGVLAVAAIRKRSLPGSHRVHLGRYCRWSLPGRGHSETIGTVFQQLLGARVRPLHEGPVQRGKANFVGGIDICAPSQEQIDAGGIAFVSCPHQTGMSLRIRRVHRYVLMEQEN